MAKRLIVLLFLVGSFVSRPVPAAAAEVPADCAVTEHRPLEFNVVIGTNASETLRGTEGADFICGLLGDDVIYAYGGNDLILGDTTTFFGNVQAPGGNDTIFAGAGDDQVLSGPGNDSVNGGAGDDFIALAAGNDVAQGGHGADTIIGGFGNDKVLVDRGTTTWPAALTTTWSTADLAMTRSPASCLAAAAVPRRSRARTAA